jgi:thymidylate synthase ThyX
MYGTGQSYEMLLLRMRSHPLPEARQYADMMLEELRKVIPSFLRRVDIAERGGEWSDYFVTTRDETLRTLERIWPDAMVPTVEPDAPEVRLIDFDPDGEDKLLSAICVGSTSMSESEASRRVALLGHDDKVALIRAYVGERRNRRHRPGRAFERTDYRFELVTDYGAFRDLQRHRILSIEWQPLGVDLGFDMPAIIEEAGLGEQFSETMERSRDLYADLRDPFPAQAGYAVSLAFRIRYSMQMNAREAIHLLELRSGPQGHPAYRRVAQDMHLAIRDQAGHRAVAEAMVHVDHNATDLERLESERRAEQRRLRVVPSS